MYASGSAYIYMRCYSSVRRVTTGGCGRVPCGDSLVRVCLRVGMWEVSGVQARRDHFPGFPNEKGRARGARPSSS